MQEIDGHQSDEEANCRECEGCVQCTEQHCIYNAHGDPRNCRREQCIYCVRFMRRDRLFLNNVG
jgi:hypothetical protein